MTKREFDFWWCAIPANIACAVANLAVVVSIPFGTWRWMADGQFIVALLLIDAIVWGSAFLYFRRHPVFTSS